MTKFVPGQSGNPGGRPQDAALRELARAETEGCIATLVEIRNSKKAPAAARVTASIAILDRGWGKPTQPLVHEGEMPSTADIIEHRNRISREIRELMESETTATSPAPDHDATEQ